MFHESQVITSILTPSGYPGDLTLNGLELILHNVRNVVTFLLKVVSVFIFNPFFFHFFAQLVPLSLPSPEVSLCFPM